MTLRFGTPGGFSGTRSMSSSRRADPGQVGDRRGEQRCGRFEPLVIAGLVGQVAEQVTEPALGQSHPPVLVVHPEQHLRSTCATARVSSSASVSRGRRPRPTVVGRCGRRSRHTVRSGGRPGCSSHDHGRPPTLPGANDTPCSRNRSSRTSIEIARHPGSPRMIGAA